MSVRWMTGRLRDEPVSASPELTRLVLLGFLIAALLGLGIGLLWVGWHLVVGVVR